MISVRAWSIYQLIPIWLVGYRKWQSDALLRIKPLTSTIKSSKGNLVTLPILSVKTEYPTPLQLLRLVDSLTKRVLNEDKIEDKERVAPAEIRLGPLSVVGATKRSRFYNMNGHWGSVIAGLVSFQKPFGHVKASNSARVSTHARGSGSKRLGSSTEANFTTYCHE